MDLKLPAAGQADTTITISLGASGGKVEVITVPLDPVIQQVRALSTKKQANDLWDSLGAKFGEAAKRFQNTQGGTPEHAQAYADMAAAQREMELVQADPYYGQLIGTD